MEGKRFDQIARGIASGNRRGFLKLTAAALASMTALAHRGVDAVCSPGGWYCQRDSDCCTGKCGAPSRGGRRRVCTGCGANGDTCAADTDCCSGICQGGTCYATIAGSCTGIAGEECANDTCSCIGGGDNLECATAPADCADSCDECAAGYVCHADSFWCGGQFPFICAIACPPEGGSPLTCFTGDTRVAIVDGSSIAIEDVRVGDKVLGMDGLINTVLRIETPPLGARKLYSFNGGPFFVTAEHPFLTEEGWKSIDPAATEREHAAVKTTTLRVGDKLRALAGVLVTAGRATQATHSVDLETQSVALWQIESITADSTMTLYNLKLDGDHTYFANDLVVHNK